MTIKMKGPWGEVRPQAGEVALSSIKFAKMQLEAMLASGRCRDRDGLMGDIQAYDLILDSGHENNASAFLEEKHTARREGRRYDDNFAVIDALKDMGIWKE